MQGNIYLIGPMGAGKTTVGRKLAHLLRCDFIDTDQALEKRTGVSVSHIFEIEGEEGFRERESGLLAEIGNGEVGDGSVVVATGGGVIVRESNRQMMRKTGTVVYLCASPALLWERLENCQSRPLLSGPDPKSTMTQLLETRAPLYAAEADVTVEACVESAAKMAAKIHELLQRHENYHEDHHENR